MDCSSCQPPARPALQPGECQLPTAGSASVDIAFLASVLDALGPVTSAAHTAFLIDVEDDVLGALGMSRASLGIAARVLRDSDSQAAARRALTASGKVRVTLWAVSPTTTPPHHAAQMLVQLFAVPDSAVYRGSALNAQNAPPTLNAHVRDTVVLAEEAPTLAQSLADLQPFQHRNVQVAPGLTLSWSVLGSGTGGSVRSTSTALPPNATLALQLACSESVWHSVAFGGRAGSMEGHLALVVQPGIDLAAASLGVVPPLVTLGLSGGLSCFHLRSVGARGVHSSDPCFSGGVVQRSAEGVTTTLLLPLHLATLPNGAALATAVGPDGVLPMSWAAGGTGDRGMAGHGQQRGGGTLNLFTGTVQAAGTAGWALAHGVLMTLAWGVGMPLTALIALFRSKKKGANDNAWFVHHRAVAIVSMCVAVGAGALATAYRAADSTPSPHGILGFAVLCAGAVQLSLGFARPSPQAGFRRSLWRGAHMACAGTVVAGSGVNIVVGWTRLTGLAPALAAAASLMVLDAALLFLYLRCACVPASSKCAPARGETSQSGSEEATRTTGPAPQGEAFVVASPMPQRRSSRARRLGVAPTPL